MSKLATEIFQREDYYITSRFGNRGNINTANGVATGFHNGCDYGTRGEKWAQFAIENGVVDSCGKYKDGALYVKIRYPRLGIRVTHWHLNSIRVVKGQTVTHGTLIGYTGMSGKATGVHLHLMLEYVNRLGQYVDPESYDYVREVKHLKSNEKIAIEVLKGYWGNGAERKTRLEKAGYVYSDIQKIVNAKVKAKVNTNTTNIDAIARAVIRGEYGNGADRKAKLTAKGYDYYAVQKRVNEILKGG